MCELVGCGPPITAIGEAAIYTVCETLGSPCSTPGGEEACAGQCEDGGIDDDSGRVVKFASGIATAAATQSYRMNFEFRRVRILPLSVTCLVC